MFVFTVSSSSLQSVPTARMSVSVTPLHSSSTASLSFGFSTAFGDSLEACAEEDEDDFWLLVLDAVGRVVQALSESIFVFSSSSSSTCLIASIACSCEAISWASIPEHIQLRQLDSRSMSPLAHSLNLVSRICTTFTSPSILAIMSAAFIEREFMCGFRSSSSIVTLLVPPFSSRFPPRSSPAPVPPSVPSFFVSLSSASCPLPLPLFFQPRPYWRGFRDRRC